MEIEKTGEGHRAESQMRSLSIGCTATTLVEVRKRKGVFERGVGAEGGRGERGGGKKVSKVTFKVICLLYPKKTRLTKPETSPKTKKTGEREATIPSQVIVY